MTVRNAQNAGAIIRQERKQGKGNVVWAMFRDTDADLYIMVDGDDTYPASEVHLLMAPVEMGIADMSVGTRLAQYEDHSFRFLHMFGNKLIKDTINILFGTNLQDILSGYRCFNRSFVKSIPILSKGFEVETELTLQALDKDFTIKEVPVPYFRRPPGSFSKLNTYMDGILVLKTIFWIFKDYRPLRFFSFIGLFCMLIGIGLGVIPVHEFIRTGLVNHPSTAVLATGFVLVSLLCFATGLILDTINRRYKEQYRLIADSVIHNIVNRKNT
jgi:hypothetical protein